MAMRFSATPGTSIFLGAITNNSISVSLENFGNVDQYCPGGVDIILTPHPEGLRLSVVSESSSSQPTSPQDLLLSSYGSTSFYDPYYESIMVDPSKTLLSSESSPLSSSSSSTTSSSPGPSTPPMIEMSGSSQALSSLILGSPSDWSVAAAVAMAASAITTAGLPLDQPAKRELFPSGGTTPTAHPEDNAITIGEDVGHQQQHCSVPSQGKLASSACVEEHNCGTGTPHNDITTIEENNIHNTPPIIACRTTGCTRTFKRDHTRRKHESSHIEIFCSFPDCKIPFKRNHDRMRHEYLRHGKALNLCKACNKTFISTKNLKNHRCSNLLNRNGSGGCGVER